MCKQSKIVKRLQLHPQRTNNLLGVTHYTLKYLQPRRLITMSVSYVCNESVTARAHWSNVYESPPNLSQKVDWRTHSVVQAYFPSCQDY